MVPSLQARGGPKEADSKIRLAREGPKMLTALLVVLSAVPATDLRQYALSLALCVSKQDEDEIRAQIKQEYEDSKIAGVVNVYSLKMKQNKVVDQHTMQAFYKKELKAIGFKAVSCNDSTLEFLWACAADIDSSKWCRDGKAAEILPMFTGYQSRAEQAALPD